MTTGIEKFRFEERVRLCFIKHRGDVLAVSEELGVPIEYVQKQAKKIKNKCRRDVSYSISTTLMEHIIFGYEQRVFYLKQSLNLLCGKEETNISICCSAPVEEKGRTRKYYVCVKCDKRSKIKRIYQEEIYRLIFSAIEMLREEDEALVNFADKMGYSNKAPVSHVRNNFLVVPESLDREIARDISQMSPSERERVRRSIEQRVLTGGVDDKRK